MDVSRMKLVVVVGAVAVAMGALVVWRVFVAPPANAPSARAQAALPPELEQLVETDAPPDPFSDDLASVLASIKAKKSRRLVLREPEDMRLLWARAIAARDNRGQFQGRPEEVDIAFPELERPLPALTGGQLAYDMSESGVQAAWRRSLSLTLLRHAIASGAPFDRKIVDRVADMAVKHLNWSHPEEKLPIHFESVLTLLLLDNRGLLSDEHRLAMLNALRHDPLIKPYYRLFVEEGATLPPELGEAPSP